MVFAFGISDFFSQLPLPLAAPHLMDGTTSRLDAPAADLSSLPLLRSCFFPLPV